MLLRSTATPPLGALLYVVAESNLSDYRDRSAPSDFHWKVLKCRMLIFSESSVLACPDYRDVKQIHVIFQSSIECRKKIYALFAKFGLAQKGELKPVTCEVFQACLQYSITARIAPMWNLLGKRYFVNNRDFLTTVGPQYAVESSIYVNEDKIDFHLKAVKVTLTRADHRPAVGDWVRVLPSLNKAVVEDYHEVLPTSGNFKSYKDLRRHWKNIHGYRLPEQESVYYSVRFWRGEPLTYPALCVLSNWPIVVPIPKREEEATITKYLKHLETKLAFIIDEPIDFGTSKDLDVSLSPALVGGTQRTASHQTQAVSLCTPTPAPARPPPDSATSEPSEPPPRPRRRQR